MNANKSVTAVFIAQYTLTVAASPPGGGTVALSPSGGTYASGTVVTLTATAASGYAFDSWSGDASGATNPATVTMDANKSVTANFKPTITVTQPAAGVGWARGRTYNIIWTSPILGSGMVKIELYRGTVLKSTITSETSNDGTYSWTVPLLLTLATDYIVKITWLTDSSVYGASGVFTIKFW
jgi:uncharacterized repeat protein (TIGR02543 family)